MNVVPALNFKDGYKADHRRQYPINTVKVYSNLTPRSSRDKEVDSIVWFGITYFIKDIFLKEFQETFFKLPKEQAIATYKRRIQRYLLGTDMDFEHIGALHDLGYLPVSIKALPEGSLVKIGTPVLTITNEIPEFYWLPNFLETIISTEVWPMTTSATTIFRYRCIFDSFALKTVGNTAFSSTYQIHDFSMRGMFGRYAAFMSGSAHLLGSLGTDTIGAIDFLEAYYNANSDTEVIGNSVAATEHSVMCMGTKEEEIETFRRLLQDVYPSGVLSIVSDTWDLWKVLTVYMSELKDLIMSRDGKLVIRPDSGDPVRILCGDVFEEFKSVEEARTFYLDEIFRQAEDACGRKKRGLPAYEVKFKVGTNYYTIMHIVKYVKLEKTDYWNVETVTSEPVKLHYPTPDEIGVVELLWNTFGGITNELGFKELDSHIGTIYGDSINFERATQICQRLMDKGFASTNWVAGVGSFTYQYTTRDQYGFAMKATYGELAWPVTGMYVNEKNQLVGRCKQVVDGEVIILEGTDKVQQHKKEDFDALGITMIEEREIFKAPITDNGGKKSAKGRIVVYRHEDGTYYMKDQVSEEEEQHGELEYFYQNGHMVKEGKLSEIRELFNKNVLLKIR